MSECVGCSRERRRRAVRTNAIGKLKQQPQKHLTHCLASPLLERNILLPKSLCWVGSQPIRTHPMTAKAGSSWRSKGKSRRKRVLKRAVIVSEEQTNHRMGERMDGREKKQKDGEADRGHSDEETRLQTRSQCSSGSVRAVKNLSPKGRE